MTVSYHSGRRIQATSTDFAGIPAVAGGWKELGRTTLGSAGILDITSLADKRYYMFLNETLGTGHSAVRFNSDTGSNYSRRTSFDGSIDYTAVSQDHLQVGNGNGFDGFNVGYFANLSAKEKLLMSWNTEAQTAGAGTAPSRREFVGKWTNTSSVISTMNNYNRSHGSGHFDSGSEAIVLGWDESDTHTTNFWEQIGTASGTGVLDVTASAKKKYNWIQGWYHPTTSADTGFQLGDGSLDTGSNYSYRQSINGAADGTGTSATGGFIYGSGSDASIKKFFNMFFINNSANEKLVICHLTYNNTAGAGTAPNRIESITKWANTSGQADHFGLTLSAGTADATSEVRWWGSD